MDEQTVGKFRSDEVQVFDIGEALKRREAHRGLARRYGKLVQQLYRGLSDPPRRGETHIYQHLYSDQTLVHAEFLGHCLISFCGMLS